MKVFKFGGASVKDADGVKNIAEIIRSFGSEPLVIIISAMGKITNALEKLCELGYKKNDYSKDFIALKKYHEAIIDQLHIQLSINDELEVIRLNLKQNIHFSFPQYYDQIVCYGELISTKIVSEYLNCINITNKLLDARDLIFTDDTWREGNLEWNKTCSAIQSSVNEHLHNQHLITQGFIGRSSDGFTITLGREGSDYTSAIFANCLDAEGLWIWKDVPGVLNADPKTFEITVQLPEITYYEAIEMSYNGAQVIHPKTLHPLRQKNIPLYVKSFIDPKSPGTIIKTDEKAID